MGDVQQGPAGAPAAGSADLGHKPKAKYLTADAILAAPDVAEEDVEVPEWGGSVRVKGLSVHDLNEANRLATVNGEVDAEKISCLVVVFGCVEPQFTPEQAGALARKSSKVINELGSAIFRLSGVGGSSEARFRSGAS